MTDHHPECEDVTGAYPGSCNCAAIRRREAMEHVIHSSMPIDFERRYAMDNLIAQDADLIEICPDDLVQRLRSTVCQGNLGCHRLVDDDEAADRIEAQAAEIERLREVLEFYAGWGVTNPVYDTVVILDGGKKARAALEQSK